MTASKAPPAGHYEPTPDRWSQPFWDAAAAGKLSCPRCGECKATRFPPTAFCWSCQSQRVEWIDLSGDATLYSFIIVRRALSPELRDAVPFVIALVEFDGAPGTRMMTNLVDCEIEDVEIGMALQVVFEELRPGFHFPRFAPKAS
jgi:uncharacterized OB-fold protein